MVVLGAFLCCLCVMLWFYYFIVCNVLRCSCSCAGWDIVGNLFVLFRILQVLFGGFCRRVGPGLRFCLRA